MLIPIFISIPSSNLSTAQVVIWEKRISLHFKGLKIVVSTRFLSAIGSFGTGCDEFNSNFHPPGKTFKIVLSAGLKLSLSGFVAIGLCLRQVFLHSFTSALEAKYRVPQQRPSPIHAGM